MTGTLEVRAGGGLQGIARQSVEAVSGQSVRCDLFLQPGQTQSGNGWRLTDAKSPVIGVAETAVTMVCGV